MLYERAGSFPLGIPISTPEASAHVRPDRRGPESGSGQITLCPKIEAILPFRCPLMCGCGVRVWVRTSNIRYASWTWLRLRCNPPFISVEFHV